MRQLEQVFEPPGDVKGGKWGGADPITMFLQREENTKQLTKLFFGGEGVQLFEDFRSLPRGGGAWNLAPPRKVRYFYVAALFDVGYSSP